MTDERLGPLRAGRALALVVCAAFYLPHAGRGFTSEDFLLLRSLDQLPPWADVAGLFSRPWLDVESLGFYRPVAWLLFGVEEAIFGTWSPGYNLVHLSVHLWSVLSVFEIIRLVLGTDEEERRGRLLGDVPALAGALAFGLYPLNPNSVSWAASYANLFGNAFVLTALWLFLLASQRSSVRGYVLSFLFALLALGSYESSVLLAPAVVLLELFVVNSRALRKVFVTMVSVMVLVAYLALRRIVVGATVGGYADFLDIFLGSLSGLLNQVGRALSLFLWPRYGAVVSGAAGWAVLVGLSLTLLICFVVFFQNRRWRIETGLLIFAALLMVGSMAPFAYRLVHPAEGRYFYLSAAALGIGWGALVRVFMRIGGQRASTMALAGVIMPLAFAPFLARHLGWMETAAGESSRLVSAMRSAFQELEPGQRLFIGSTPQFVVNERGVNLAQIHHYGLRDSVMRPFAEDEIEVYPLVGPSRPAALALGEFGQVRDWHDGRLEPVRRTGSLPFDGIEIVAWTDGSVPRELRFRLSPELRNARFEMALVAAGNMLRHPFSPELEGDSQAAETLSARGRGPEGFLEMMSTLYPGTELFVWIEARDRDSRLLGLSPAISFELTPPNP